MKTFNDLVFTEHHATIPEDMKKSLIEQGMSPNSEVLKPMSQARLTFDNGHSISVVFGAIFYSNGVNTYEAMASYDTEPRGYLSTKEVSQYMEEVQLHGQL